MSNNKINNYISTNIVKVYTLGGMFFGLAFPIFAVGIGFLAFKYPANMSGIVQMHAENVLYYIIDMAPLVLMASSYLLAQNISEKRKELLLEIEQKDKLIQKNAKFARQIGEGNFSGEDFEVTEDDTLGQSLILMRDNLVATYQKENELNWITRGKEISANILRKGDEIEIMAYEMMVSLVNYTASVQGSFYVFDDERNKLVNVSTYAYNRKKYVNQEFEIGQGLIGQAAYEKEYIYRKEIPDDYFTITSGLLGDKKPKTVLITPLIGNDELQGVIEIASLEEEMPRQMITLFQELKEIIGQTLFNLKASTRTIQLLEDSRKLTARLRKNEDELRRNAEQMQMTQIELEKSNKELATKMAEVERGQNRLRALLENASEVITIYDENGIVEYVSPSVKKILGFNEEEMIGKNRFERGESVLQEAFNKLIKDPLTPQIFEYRYENKNKEIVWLETVGRNLIDNAAIGGVIFNTRDITVRKIAEKAQRLSGEMQALSENSLDMILRTGPNGKIYYANPQVENFLGVTQAEVAENTIAMIDIDDSIKEFLSSVLRKVIETGKKIDAETVFNINNNQRIVLLNAIPEYNKEKELETILFVAHDITERKQFELEIEKKNKNITESINYAKRIQTAIIPDNDYIKRYLPKSFIFYKPRDVVSGDFPWFFIKGDYIYIAAVDCTGHGVPGALLSFIGYFILNNIVDHDDGYTAGEILDKFHHQVRITLKQDSPDANARDGMDVALCKINPKKRELEYSGAHRPLYYVKGAELTQYKGTPKAIGGIPIRKRAEPNFVTHKIKIESKDKIFFFSDGLPDQIGGPKGRKYQARNIRENIIKHKDYTMDQYYDLFDSEFKNWKGNKKQVDDVLLIGIEF